MYEGQIPRYARDDANTSSLMERDGQIRQPLECPLYAGIQFETGNGLFFARRAGIGQLAFAVEGDRRASGLHLDLVAGVVADGDLQVTYVLLRELRQTAGAGRDQPRLLGGE